MDSNDVTVTVAAQAPAAPTAEEQLQAIQERREARKAMEKAAYDAQRVLDMTALADLEDELGYERVKAISLSGWRPGEGAATMVVVRLPRKSEAVFKRFEQMLTRAKEGTPAKLEAQTLLAESCLVYPSKKDSPELYNATMELAPGVLSNAAFQIVVAVQGQAEVEGKD